MAVILIVKTQGENRERGADGKLHATQEAWLKPALAVNGHIQWWGPRRKTVEQARRTAEDLAGQLTWHGFPDFGGLLAGFSGETKHIKAAARWNP